MVPFDEAVGVETKEGDGGEKIHEGVVATFFESNAPERDSEDVGDDPEPPGLGVS